jgi:hypothetical protein
VVDLAETPGWVQNHAIITALAYILQFVFGFIDATPGTSGNIIDVVADFFVFQTIPDMPGWFGFLLFMIFPLPWILYLTAHVFGLFGSFTGTVVAVIVIGIVGGLIFAGFSP